MYVPSSFQEDREEVVFDFIDAYPFATLVSQLDRQMVATHLPLVLDRQRRVLLGHFAKANPQWKHEATSSADANSKGSRPSLAIFHGPHAYISPLMYQATPAVPTWNYAAVHISAELRILERDDQTEMLLQTLVAKFDTAPERWQKAEHASFYNTLRESIVPFEMPLTKIEAKFKLGQNRSPADQAKMLTELEKSNIEGQQLAAFARNYASKNNTLQE